VTTSLSSSSVEVGEPAVGPCGGGGGDGLSTWTSVCGYLATNGVGATGGGVVRTRLAPGPVRERRSSRSHS